MSSLTSHQKLFLKEKRLDGQLTADEWLSFFAGISEFDRRGDLRRAKLNKGCIAVAVLLLISFIAGFFVTFVPFFFVVIVAVVLAILRGTSNDVSNNFRQFAVPLVFTLREDLPPTERIHLRLDLRGGTAREKAVNGPQPPARRGEKITDEHFFDPWMYGRTRLADGSRLDWSVASRIRKRSEGKTRSSGKYKVKTKVKVKSMVTVRLKPKKDVYLVSRSGPARQREEVSIQERDRRYVIKVRQKVISDNADALLDLGDFLAVIALAYRRVYGEKVMEK